MAIGEFFCTFVHKGFDMNRIKEEFNALRLIFLFYSRIPVGRVEYSDRAMSRAFRYFPSVGAVVGGLSAVSYWIFASYFTIEIGVVAAIAVALMLTGGMHEDGFSDFCDAFGGYRSREDTLRIMKDSATGVYGVLGIVVLLLAKYSLLKALPMTVAPWVIVVTAVVARYAPIVVMRSMSYARKEGEQSKSTHLRETMSWWTVSIASAFVIASLLLLSWRFALGAIVLVSVVIGWIAYVSKKRIGGYTGDVLGALEQLCEIALLLVAVYIY